jgi:hypothetical protein
MRACALTHRFPFRAKARDLFATQYGDMHPFQIFFRLRPAKSVRHIHVTS